MLDTLKAVFSPPKLPAATKPEESILNPGRFPKELIINDTCGKFRDEPRMCYTGNASERLERYLRVLEDTVGAIQNHLSVGAWENHVDLRTNISPELARLPIEPNGAIGFEVARMLDGTLLRILTPLGAFPFARGEMSPKCFEHIRQRFGLMSLLPETRTASSSLGPLYCVRLGYKPGTNCNWTNPPAELCTFERSERTKGELTEIWRTLRPDGLKPYRLQS